MKKILSVLLVMVITIALFPALVSAEGYTVSGDALIFKTPVGAASIVQYTLMDAGTPVTEGVTWSVNGTGVSIDNTGRLTVTNKANGTFDVVATVAGETVSKTVKVSENFLFYDYTNVTDATLQAGIGEAGHKGGTATRIKTDDDGNKYVTGGAISSSDAGSDNNSIKAIQLGADLGLAEMYESKPKAITLEGKFKNSSGTDGQAGRRWLFFLYFNNAAGTGLLSVGGNLGSAERATYMRVVDIRANQANGTYTLVSDHDATGKAGNWSTGHTSTATEVGTFGKWVDIRTTLDYEKKTYTVWADDQIIYDNYPLPEVNGEAAQLRIWCFGCDGDDIAIYSGYKRDYKVSGDDVIFKTPEGTESIVQYKLLDGSAQVTEGVKWKLVGTGYEGVTLDASTGKLTVTNNASGIFDVAATVAGETVSAKTVEVSNHFLFYDFENMTDDQLHAGNDAGLVGQSATKIEEEADGNKYAVGGPDFNYTPSGAFTSNIRTFLNAPSATDKGVSEMHENKDMVVTLEGKFKNNKGTDGYNGRQWLFFLGFSFEDGTSLSYGSMSASQGYSLRAVDIREDQKNGAYQLANYFTQDGTLTNYSGSQARIGTDIGTYGDWVNVRMTIDFGTKTYTVWADDRIIWQDYKLPERDGKTAASLRSWYLSCPADDIAIYSGYKIAEDIPEESLTKGKEAGEFIINGIVKEAHILWIAKYDGDKLVSVAKADCAPGGYVSKTVTVPSYDAKYTYKVLWWKNELRPVISALGLSAAQ